MTSPSAWRDWLDHQRHLDAAPALDVPVPSSARPARRALPRLVWVVALLLVAVRAAATLAFLFVL